jgi:hypothetical protein
MSGAEADPERTPRSPRREALWAGAGAALFVLAVGAASLQSGTQSGDRAAEAAKEPDGLIRVGAEGLVVCSDVDPIAAMRSTAAVWVESSGDERVSVTGWETVGGDGLEVVGVALVAASDFETGGGAGLVGFPPPDLDIPATSFQPLGALAVDIEPQPTMADDHAARRADRHVVVVGYRLAEGFFDGHIDDVELAYTIGDRRSTLPLDLRLELRSVAPCYDERR